jgi:hypothetical protein
MKAIAKRKSRYNAFLGADPGENGGIAVVFGEQSYRPVVYQLPEADVDLFNLLQQFDPNFNVFACVELVHSSPQMGVASAFTFGLGYGKLLMGLTAAGIPYIQVTPQKWQAALSIRKRDADRETQNQFKDRLLAKAKSLHPKLPIWSEPKSLGRQRAIADALLIAKYCYLTYR